MKTMIAPQDKKRSQIDKPSRIVLKGQERVNQVYCDRNVADSLSNQGLKFSKTPICNRKPGVEFASYEVSYHTDDFVYITTKRAVCSVSDAGLGYVELRIATKDRIPDKRLIDDLHTKYPGIDISLTGNGISGVRYSLVMRNVPVQSLKESMDRVDEAGNIVLEAKEYAAFPFRRLDKPL